MTTISEILNIEMLNLSMEKLGLFFIIILLTYIVRFLFLHIIEKKIVLLTQKTSTEFDDLVVQASKAPLGYLILLHGFYFAIISLQLPETIGVVNITGIVQKVDVLILSFIVKL